MLRAAGLDRTRRRTAHGADNLVGNADDRRAASLRNPSKDASDFADRLRKLGFAASLLADGTQRQMSRAITRFGEKLSGDSVALFHYAGHGIQAAARNYLIPVDAEIASEPAVRSEEINVERILAQLQRARLSIVILDACRDNPYERGFRGSGGGLAQLDAPKGTLIAYATAPGHVADDGRANNSPYTSALLESLRRPQRAIEDLFKEVRATVAELTRDRQIPWVSSSLTGDFCFEQPSGDY